MATEKNFRYKHLLSNVEDKAPTSAQILDGEIAVNTFAGSEKMFIKNASGNIVSFSSDNAIGEIIIDNTSGKVDTTTFETYSGNVDTAINSKLATSDFNTYSGAVDTAIGSKAAQSDLNALSGTVTGHTADTDIHVTSSDKTAWNNKLDSSDIANFFDDAKYEDSGTSKVINFYHGNTIKATINADDFIKDGMIEGVSALTSGSTTVLDIKWNTAAGGQETILDIGDMFEADNYYTKSETSGKTEISTALARKANTATTLAGYGITDAYTKTEVDNKLGTGFSVSSVTEVIKENELVTSEALNDLDGRIGSGFSVSSVTEVIIENELVASEALNDLDGRIGSGFSVSSVTEVMESKADKTEDLDGVKLKKITQSAYDALVQAGTTDPNTLYIITDNNS